MTRLPPSRRTSSARQTASRSSAVADTIREFLVTLGFRVNDAQYRRFIKPIADATDAMSTLSKVTFATAAAIFYTVDKIADQYERLYYASKRTEQSTQALQSYAFA